MTDAVVVVFLAGLAAVLLVAGWRARTELTRGGDSARARDIDPDSMTRWHRAMRALRRVTRPFDSGVARPCPGGPPATSVHGATHDQHGEDR